MKHSAGRNPPREWDSDRLYAYGLRFLGYRARSELEIRQRFQQRAAAPELIDEVIARLRSAGLVDDESFARAWVDSRRRASPRGDRLLKYELVRKGIPAETIENTLAKTEDGSDLELAHKAATQRARRLSGVPEPAFSRRLTDFLIRRGFDYDVVATVVAQVRPAGDGSD
ncbi:MAG: regulatory protein RecX [Chloroflexi bacterium]|nr:regulatory protein RecX [Chloroflexota bacterium]